MLVILFFAVMLSAPIYAQHPFSAKYHEGRVVRVTNHPICQQEHFSHSNTLSEDSIGVCYFDLIVSLQRPPDASGSRNDIPDSIFLEVWDGNVKVNENMFQDTVCIIENLLSNTPFVLKLRGNMPNYTEEDIARIISIKIGNLTTGLYKTRATDVDFSGSVYGQDALIVARTFMHHIPITPTPYEILDESDPLITPFSPYVFSVILLDDLKKEALLVVRGDSTY